MTACRFEHSNYDAWRSPGRHKSQHVTRQYLEERGALEPVGNDELVRRVRTGEVTLLDVRPREEYVAAQRPVALVRRRQRNRVCTGRH